MLLILLPAIFIVVFLDLNGYHARGQTPWADGRMAFLQTAAFLGGYMILFAELLSLFHALTTVWVTVFWGLALVLATGLGWKMGWISAGFNRLKYGWKKPGWFDVLAGSVTLIILGLLFFIAVKSPVNNNDSLEYHMSRVMHWAQDQGLQHYATAFIPQLIHPIWSELAILNLFLLSGTDRFSALIQWLSLVGVLIGVSALTRLWGANRIGQWLAVAFVISLPTGILEASSTQNDYVVAFWLICLLYFIFRCTQTDPSPLDFLTIGLALGLGLLTKGTFLPYAAPPMLFLLIHLFSKRKFSRALVEGLSIGLVAILLNLGLWSRNTITFGTPLGSRAFISLFAPQTIGPVQVLSGLSKNITQNFPTPDDRLNAEMVAGLKSIFGKFDPAMQSYNIEWAWNHEDLAGNPVHFILVLVSSVILILLRRRINNPMLWIYLLVVLGMYVLLASMIRFDLFGVRYQLPFFVAWAPLFGMALAAIGSKKIGYAIIILLMLSAFPWVMFNRTRPLIAMRNSKDPFTIPCLAGCTAGSILNEPPEKTMFAVWGTLGGAYVDAMKQVKATGCTQIGLKLDSSDLEYAYWWLLGAPQNGMRLESIVTYPELERYLDPGFKPCVIICSTCGDQAQLFGLARIGSYGDGKIKVFSGGNFDLNKP